MNIKLGVKNGACVLNDSTIDNKTATVSSLRFDFVSAVSPHLPAYSYLNHGLHHITAQPGDSLMKLGRQYGTLMGYENPVNAAIAIAASNALIGPGIDTKWQDVRLSIGQPLQIPIANGIEIRSNVLPTAATNDALSLTLSFASAGLLPGTLVSDDMVRAAKLLQVLNPTHFTSDGKLLSSLATMNVPVADDFAHIKPLQNPGIVQGAFTTLLIAEGNDDQHQRDTFDYAVSYARALRGNSDWQAIHAYKEPVTGNLGQTILPHIGKDTENDYLIISQSYAIKPEAVVETKTDTFEYNSQALFYRNNPEAMDSGIIHFIAAGNSGQHPQLSQTHLVWTEQLGGRSTIVGAVHKSFDGSNVMASYNSPGSDILAPPVALQDGQYRTGTSFATPMMAALDKQMLDIYGKTLTPEEIMNAAFMSTDMDIKKETVALSGPDAVTFTTNAGGRPHDAYAGAGMIDPEKWQANLNIMAGIKMRMEHQPDYIVHQEDLGAQRPEKTKDLLGSTVYTYQITIPQDMTLDRLSLVLPRIGNDKDHGGVTLTSPNGFTFNVPNNPMGLLGTSAFAMEDVKAGDTLTLTVRDKPLSGDARVVVRGYEDGNVIQALRDNLMEQGLLPQPNTEYVGTEIRADYEARLAAEAAIKQRMDQAFGGLSNPSGNLLTGALPPGSAPPTDKIEIKF